MKSESPRNQLVIAPSRHVRSCDRTEIVTLIALLLSPRKGHLAEAGQTEGGAFFQIHRLYAGPFRAVCPVFVGPNTKPLLMLRSSPADVVPPAPPIEWPFSFEGGVCFGRFFHRRKQLLTGS